MEGIPGNGAHDDLGSQMEGIRHGGAHDGRKILGSPSDLVCQSQGDLRGEAAARNRDDRRGGVVAGKVHGEAEGHVQGNQGGLQGELVGRVWGNREVPHDAADDRKTREGRGDEEVIRGMATLEDHVDHGGRIFHDVHGDQTHRGVRGGQTCRGGVRISRDGQTVRDGV
ncbi:hypothetical protein PF007_g5651 [Phytophthora fragariae]|uniref:Uncharacterized protein n=1 Tax=Phytophthora fragariae TaxID=53985 RepID=A0A6A3T0U5_9STRA|nr:hypothetical protein PF007_g5651 [Phytophthora fragariae]